MVECNTKFNISKLVLFKALQNFHYSHFQWSSRRYESGKTERVLLTKAENVDLVETQKANIDQSAVATTINVTLAVLSTAYLGTAIFFADFLVR